MNVIQPSLRRILWERQGHKCAGCDKHLESHKLSCRGKIGLDDFIACAPCISTAGEYKTLADFHRDHSTGERQIRLEQRRQEKATKLIENPEGYQTIVEAVRELGSDVTVPDHFRYLPASAKFVNIAHQLVNGPLSVEERRLRDRAKRQRRIKRRGRVRGGASRTTLKFALGEAQNHRCAYCQCGMHYEKSRNTHDWHYATFEHVFTVLEIEREKFNSQENLVLACMFCNGERSRMHMTAEQFYAWVQAHKLEHEARRANIEHAPFMSKAKWTKRKLWLQNSSKHHINSESLVTKVK